jgi:hypothetical protein
LFGEQVSLGCNCSERKCHCGAIVRRASVTGVQLFGEQVSHEHLSGEQLSLESKCP